MLVDCEKDAHLLLCFHGRFLPANSAVAVSMWFGEGSQTIAGKDHYVGSWTGQPLRVSAGRIKLGGAMLKGLG